MGNMQCSFQAVCSTFILLIIVPIFDNSVRSPEITIVPQEQRLALTDMGKWLVLNSLPAGHDSLTVV